MKELLPYIIDKISDLRYEIHSFDSGAVMVDIWKGNSFYVIQIYQDEIGLSLVTAETTPFDTTPDQSFKNTDEFKKVFESILG